MVDWIGNWGIDEKKKKLLWQKLAAGNLLSCQPTTKNSCLQLQTISTLTR
jgi:hypothetical protein